MIDFFSKKLSLRENLRRGYQISPAGDGEATIHNPNSGATYTISNFECDCPDKTKRNGSHDGHCKHEVWVSQMRPCPRCDRYQLLAQVQVAGAEESLYEYRCSNGHISSWEEVKAPRAANEEGL